MPFTNPLVAGLTLIRTSIRSPNYVANVSGWSINKDGSAEFNDVVVRGTVIAGGGTVTLSSTGIRVVGAGNQYDISTTAGFVARKLPDTGQLFQITPETLYFRPPTPSPLGNAIDTGFIDTYRVTFSGGTVESPSIRWESPNITGKAAAAIDLRGQKSSSAFDDSAFVYQGGDFRVEAALNETHVVDNDFTVDAGNNVVLNSVNDFAANADNNLFLDSASSVVINSDNDMYVTAPLTRISNRLISDDTGVFDFAPSQLFSVNIGVGVGDTNVSLGNTNYPIAFTSGRTVFVMSNINNASGASALWYSRAIHVSNTQFNVIVSRPSAAASATTLNITVAAFVLPQ